MTALRRRAPLLLVLVFATGCAALVARAGGAVDTAEYSKALDGCLEEARDAGKSLAVYERCAHEADVKYGLRGATTSAADAGGQ